MLSSAPIIGHLMRLTGSAVLVDLAMLLKRRRKRTLIKSRESTVSLLKLEARNHLINKSYT